MFLCLACFTYFCFHTLISPGADRKVISKLLVSFICWCLQGKHMRVRLFRHFFISLSHFHLTFLEMCPAKWINKQITLCLEQGDSYLGSRNFKHTDHLSDPLEAGTAMPSSRCQRMAEMMWYGNFLQNELWIKLSFLLGCYSPQDWICRGSLASLVTSYRSCRDGLSIFRWQREERNTFHTSRRTVQHWDYKRIHHKFYWEKKMGVGNGNFVFQLPISILVMGCLTSSPTM